MYRLMSRCGLLGGQEEELGADQVGVLVVDLGPEEDDALLEEPLIDVAGPVEPEASWATGEG